MANSVNPDLKLYFTVADLDLPFLPSLSFQILRVNNIFSTHSIFHRGQTCLLFTQRKDLYVNPTEMLSLEVNSIQTMTARIYTVC